MSKQPWQERAEDTAKRDRADFQALLRRMRNDVLRAARFDAATCEAAHVIAKEINVQIDVLNGRERADEETDR